MLRQMRVTASTTQDAPRGMVRKQQLMALAEGSASSETGCRVHVAAGKRPGPSAEGFCTHQVRGAPICEKRALGLAELLVPVSNVAALGAGLQGDSARAACITIMLRATASHLPCREGRFLINHPSCGRVAAALVVAVTMEVTSVQCVPPSRVGRGRHQKLAEGETTCNPPSSVPGTGR